MALDAAILSLAAAELKQALRESRIDKIFEPTRDEVVITLRTRTETFKLLLSARSGSARVCFTTESFENPAMPPSFCMLLRKHLNGGRLMDVRMQPGDRIVFFDFQCVNEMGDLVMNTLAAELMGRYSNLVLFQNDKIIDALKRVDFEDSEVRQLLPGLKYTLPPPPPRPEFFSMTSADLVAAVMAKDIPVADALLKCTSGVGPVVCREAAYRAFGNEAPASAAAMTQEQQRKLCKALEEIRQIYEKGGEPVSVHEADGRAVEYSFLPLTQYGTGFTSCRYGSYSEMLENYYATKDRAERLRQKGKELFKAVRNMYDRAVRKQAARQEELAVSERSDKLRLYGELLQANLWAVQKGQPSVTVVNYYDGKEVKIPLDVRLSASANAQKYFRNYKKKQTAAKMLVKLLEEGAHEIEYLETVMYEVESASGEQELGEIRAELKAQGYLKYYKIRDKKQKPADFLRFTSTDGFEILVGRNNIQNDKLTLHTARGKDLWFHVQKAPGSHVVVMSRGQDIPLPTQQQAAELAVLYSSRKGGGKVPVDTTEVRNIRKPAGTKPGLVVYDIYTTVYVTPQEGLAAQLQKLH